MAQPDNIATFFKELMTQTGLAVVTMVTHAFLALVLMLCVYGIEKAFDFVNHGDLLLFGKLPIGYLFDFSNFAILIMFVFHTFVSTFSILRKRQH